MKIAIIISPILYKIHQNVVYSEESILEIKRKNKI
jgi:hypothetical protein